MSDTHCDLTVDYRKISVFRETGAENTQYPLVVSVPHAGKFFPPEFMAATPLTEKQLRSNEDLFIDEIMIPLARDGITVLCMNVARAFIDVNRDKVEIDSKMFYDFPENKITIENNRCRYGLGLVHRVDAANNPIYKGLLSYAEIQERIKNVYDVYHKRLQKLIAANVKKFGFCTVLDCHSMPSRICGIIPDSPRIDFCIGDLFGQSCPPRYTDFLLAELGARGYTATANVPYSGAFTTFNYCQPRRKIYTLQLEINREIYADEKNFEKNNYFQKVSEDVAQSIRSFAKKLLDF